MHTCHMISLNIHAMVNKGHALRREMNMKSKYDEITSIQQVEQQNC